MTFMKTLLDVLKRSTEYLEQRGISHPRRQSEDLIADALGIKRMQLYLEFDRPLTEAELTDCRARLMRRGKGEPLQYIHGKVEFHDCTLKVDSGVLIPRQETEILVDKIIQALLNQDLAGKVLWDVCCGSGCIGIAIKKKYPELEVVLSDLSAAALKVARENAQLNSVDVAFVEGDLLKPFFGKRADYVVCNPPYIAENEFKELNAEVRDFEPRMALIGGITGLEFYDRLAKELPSFLSTGGKVWFEIGKGQGAGVSNLFCTAPWTHNRVEQDWAGHDRFFFLEIE